jgi:hypothetical protein
MVHEEEAGTRGFAPGPERQEYLRRLEILVDQVASYGSLSSLKGSASFHVATPTGELADNELLGQAGADAFRRADCEISKD